MNHLAEETMSRYLDNELPRPARETAEEHLSECPECRRALVHWQAFDALAREVYPKHHFAAPANRRSPVRRLLALAAGLCLVASVGMAWAAVTGRWPFLPEPQLSAPALTAANPEEQAPTLQRPSQQIPFRPVETSSLPADESQRPMHGRVFDLAGNPLAGARVSGATEHATQIGPWVHLNTVGSDQNGQFEIPTRGISALLIEKEGYLPAAVPNVALLDALGAEVDVCLVRNQEQLIQLSDSAGNPVPDAHGEPADSGYYGGLRVNGISDDEGLLKLALSPMGWPEMVVHAPPLATMLYRHPGWVSESPRPLNLGPGASLRVRLMRKGLPVPGAIVRMSAGAGQDQPPRWVLATDPEGVAEFNGIAFPNEYKVAAQDLDSRWPEVEDAIILDTPALAELQLEVPDEFPKMIEGTVLLPKGVDNAFVRVYAEGYRFPVDEEGRFHAPQGARMAIESELLADQNEPLVMQPDRGFPVTERSYVTLRPVDATGAPLAQVWLRDPSLLSQETAELHAIFETDEGQLRLPMRERTYLLYSPELATCALFDPTAADGEAVLDQPTGSFEGHVKTSEGHPRKDILVTLMLDVYRWMGQTDDTGYFRISDIPMNRGFRVMLSGGIELESDIAEKKYFASANSSPVLFKAAKERPRVWGQVVYADGSPAARARVRLQYSDREEMRESDWNGAFIVEPESGVQLTALSGEDIESPSVYATSETKSVRLQLPIEPDPEAQWVAVERAQRMNDYKQMGLVFKMFAFEQENKMLPPMDQGENAFHPEREKIYPEYLTDDTFFEWLEGEGTVYTGFALDNEEAGLAFLDAYAQLGSQGVSEVDLGVAAGTGTLGGDTLYRLREGLPATDAVQSEIPIVFELPGAREADGGLVLYMDGHVEWVEYPGKFPMTENFVNRLRQLRGLEPEANTDGAGASVENGDPPR